ncbi:MAG: hypothetical protein JXA01_02860 [Dehalococcoidia bacterium]|nr:hypothetical protein [Dehalococcoidia bacterium]
MLKNRTMAIVTILVLALAIVAMSCAPAAPAATEPAKPAATEPAKLSFEATTFTSDKNGYSMQYPKSWTVTANPDYDLMAKDGSETTADTLICVTLAKADDISKAAKDFLDNTPTFKQYNVKCDIKSTKETKLADGTPAVQTEMFVQIIIYAVNIYVVGATKGDKTVLVYTYTFGTKLDKIKEIANTLVFK